MKRAFKNLFGRAREEHEVVEREQMERLEQAETMLRDLQERGSRATSILAARDRRNHWRESIEQMIMGAQ